jgi:alkylated DNA repair protein alkB family protein 1
MTNSKVQRHRRKEPNPDWTPFRSAEKKYKSQFPPPDISNVLDLARLNPARESEIKSGVWSGCTKPDAIIDISRETSNTKVYILPEIPGTMQS